MQKTGERTMVLDKTRTHYATPRQQALADEICKTENFRTARKNLLRKVGYSPITAEKKTEAIFNSEGLTFALIANGITPETLLKPACDALQATQATWYQGKLYKSEEPDLNMRLKGADQIADVMGLKKTIVEQRTLQVNVELDDISHLL